ncbi:MarR family transcriptional regulator [Pseudactinotalea sp. HY160]|uniref:MarR family winged helix-turn-helix transcriptional regulator n=1 Tax=Pseudactinotalea sp. HY160 TaxID=2654490 RepID=UPI00188403F7
MIDDHHAGQILAEMVRIARTFHRAGQNGRERSLAGTEFGILQCLRGGDARLSEIAHRIQVSAAVTSRAVVSLETEGLVERRTDPHDARAARISMTAAGRARLVERESRVVAEFGDALGDWSAADAEQAIALLARLNRDLGAVIDPPAPAATDASAAPTRKDSAG